MKKLMKSMRFAPNLEKKVDMSKVNLDTVKPWVTRRVTELLGFEDDVVIEFVFNMLENERVRSVAVGCKPTFNSLYFVPVIFEAPKATLYGFQKLCFIMAS